MMSTIDFPAISNAPLRAAAPPRTLTGHAPESFERFERIPCRVFRHAGDASRAVAAEIATLIRGRAAEGRRCVLGLATGNTPVGVYAELVRMHHEEDLSFRHVVTFNLDEYFPMRSDELQSYVRFMREQLFDLVDIDPKNVHIPDGMLSEDQVEGFCQRYEAAIREAGGIDLQLLGIGRTGHIGFNEPGSGPDSRTRLITLDRVTRGDAASDFFGEENVPRRAITMGVGTILGAKQVLLMAFGRRQSERGEPRGRGRDLPQHRGELSADAFARDVCPRRSGGGRAGAPSLSMVGRAGRMDGAIDP